MMKKFKQAIAILFVGAGIALFLVANSSETTGGNYLDRFYVITNGECFAYGTAIWVSGDCFDTKEEANTEMNGFLEFRASKKKFKESNWVEVIDHRRAKP